MQVTMLYWGDRHLVRTCACVMGWGGEEKKMLFLKVSSSIKTVKIHQVKEPNQISEKNKNN